MSYFPNRITELAFLTTTPLASSATYDSGVLDMTLSSQVQTEVLASHDGNLGFTFYSDAGGTDAIRTLTVPYVAARGFQLYAAPTFGNYVRYTFTNTSPSLQTDMYYSTKFVTRGISPQILARTGFLAPAMTSTLFRPASDFNSDRNVGLIGGEASGRKFGANLSVGGALETVWTYGSDWVPNQLKNEKLRIAAGGNANDTAAGTGAQSVQVNFLDENLAEVTETLVTAGTSASAATSANCFRLTSARVIDVGTYHGTNTADIVLELTGGNVMGNIAAGAGTTEQAIFCVPAGKTMYITEILVSVGQADSCDVRLFRSADPSDVTGPTFSGVYEEWGIYDFSGAVVFPLTTHLVFPAGTDVWFEAEKVTGGGSARVGVDFNFYTVTD
jgi:hypothetical protein